MPPIWLNFSKLIYPGYMAPEGDDAKGGGASDTGEDKGDGGQDKGPDIGARMETIEKAVGLLARGNHEMTQAMTQLVSKFESFNKPADDKENKDSHRTTDEDVDYETMDRKTFAAHLMGNLRGLLQESLKPLGTQFGQLSEKIDATQLSGMIKEFSADHPDFFEWKDEIKALAKENPTLTPARLYTLARSENAEKAKKVDVKYGLNQPKSRGADIMSLFPSSTGASHATEGKTGRMTPKAAAEAAWDKVMSEANLP